MEERNRLACSYLGPRCGNGKRAWRVRYTDSGWEATPIDGKKEYHMTVGSALHSMRQLWKTRVSSGRAK